MQLAGIGETTATAVASTVGNGHDFTCGRQFRAWLGLVPRQYSSGGKQRLGCITKAGDPYLRSLLVMGARAVFALAMNKTNPRQDPVSRWARGLVRRGYWHAVEAVAAKSARMCDNPVRLAIAGTDILSRTCIRQILPKSSMVITLLAPA